MSTDTASPIFELLGVQDDASAIVVQNIFADRDNLVLQLSSLDLKQPDFVAVATPIVSDAKALLKNVEKAREEIKSGPLRICRQIDDKAKEFRTELANKVSIVETQIGEAVRREREERERKEREAREAQFAALEKERLEKLALEAKLANAKSDFARGKIEADIAKVERQATTTIQTQAAVIQTASQPVLTGGSQVRTGYDVNVTNLLEAFKAQPQLFTISFDRSKFNAWIKLQPPGTIPVVPGLQITPTVKASIR